MATRYFIRNRGKRLGPLSIDKLHSMAKRGRFGRHFEVSTDGKRWSHADDFPELFPGDNDDDDLELGDDFDDEGGSYDEPLDPYAPLVDDDKPVRRRPGRSSASGGRTSRRRSSRSSEDEGTEQGSSRRRRTPAARSGAVSRRSRDSEDAPSSRRARRSKDDEEAPPKRRKRPASSDDAPDDPPPRKKKKKSAPASNIFDDVEPTQNKKKKRGGLMGFLFGGAEDDSTEPPHLRKLSHIHKTLRSLGFSLDKLIFVGSGGEEVSVREHIGTGDGPHLLGLLTLIGFQSRTTDIHMEPSASGVDVRMRIDGTLVHLVEFPKESVKRLFGIVKVLCETKLGASQDVLEGNYSSVAPGRRSDYRVSFTPSVHGHKVAIRVLDAENAPQTLKQLGAPSSFVRTINGVMTQNAGMVLMCGPTGSGKTTTLYSMLRSVDFKSRNVMTLEDPVEYQINGITQINIDADHGKGFKEMLPALLRQDPDVLLIGEIRDAESAKIAMQATMTGHLVLSTVHAPDTLSTLFRLLDLNADPNMVGSALDLIMSQRLLRTLCDECKVRRRPDKEDKRRLGASARDAIFEPGGCKKCLGTGYSGRRAIFELLDVKKQVGDAIHDKPSIVDLRKAVRSRDFTSLRQNGYSLVGKGVTTFDEVDRVIGVE
ncbi:ATPase, T2SS/T4P/T4SS family [Fuerstiella marisgermanici]|uniref:Type II traffic warden ATPase n=1 Tax=Fuerstiella marisgermanici TaxID=1891926 RepID=A0A1P8WP48_9PLAN|nr:ATPase, T2SS/T4P/T4SS family [Fuerstiella marisgermanici]APZ95834.1 Type II traffic warden ATPase [Fuerstiella marisgermanici]